MNLKNRTILITGGTSGIGLELARQLLARGNTVIITGRDQDRLDSARRELPGVHPIQSDVGDLASIAELHTRVLAWFPGLDTIVNNAGIMRNLDLNSRPRLEDLTREIDINLIGPIRVVQTFLPHLKTVERALIVNVSSMFAFLPYPSSPVYSATKAALHSYTQSLRVQLADTGITVVELAPPGVETPLLTQQFAREMQGQKLMDVQTLCRITIEKIESGKQDIRPGISRLVCVLSRLAPGFGLNQMVKALSPKTGHADQGLTPPL